MTFASDGASPAAQRHSPDPSLPPSLSADVATALFLDFDGTLVEIADDPNGVRVPADFSGLLNRLSTLVEGRIAIVTGRSIAALEALTGSLSIAVAGSHGGEFRIGNTTEALAAPLPEAVADAMADHAAANGGLLVERKPFSIAVHYRHHPEARDGLLAFAQGLATQHGLAFKHGKFVVELTMPGSDKGSAVARFMALPAFQGAVPVFLGDDVTDEDAFRTVRDLGGHGILVGPMRETAADFRLPDVAAVHEWLASGLLEAHKGYLRA